MIWTGCLGLGLAWGGGTAVGSDFAGNRSGQVPPAASLGRPVATLGRPMPVVGGNSGQVQLPRVDQEVQPVSLNLFGRPRPVERLVQGGESTLPPPKPMPAAPGTSSLGETPVVPYGQPFPGGGSVHHSAPLCDEGNCAPGTGILAWPWECCPTPPSRFWVNGEYLLWWLRDSNLPPLVTTSPVGTSRDQAGVLGQPGTTTLLGDSRMKHDERSGGRFSFGWWFDECRDWGLDGSFFFLGQRNNNFLASSAGSPILARPFVNVATGQEASELVAFPGVISGTVRVDIPSRLWGADGNLRHNLCRGQCWSLDKLIGFRYLDLHESLTVNEFLSVPGAAGQAPSIIIVNDRFSTRNQFYGGQFGLAYEVRKGKWFVDVTGKVALGATHQVVNIDGTTTFVPAGTTPVTQPGGLLAQRTNSGRFTRNEFSVVPEIGLKLGCQFTQHLRGYIGYNFLYWSNVARPGQQIDRVVNTSQIPSVFGPGQLVGPARPAFTFRDTDFWAQGITFGLELRY